MVNVRLYQEADRDEILNAGNRPGVVDSPQNRLLVSEEAGEIVGYTLWIWPGIEDAKIPTLGSVEVLQPDRRDIYDALLEAVCLEAQAMGHKRGQALIDDEAVLKLMQETFVFSVISIGKNVKTGKPGRWVIEFDLEENRKILVEHRRE